MKIKCLFTALLLVLALVCQSEAILINGVSVSSYITGGATCYPSDNTSVSVVTGGVPGTWGGWTEIKDNTTADIYVQSVNAVLSVDVSASPLAGEIGIGTLNNEVSISPFYLASYAGIGTGSADSFIFPNAIKIPAGSRITVRGTILRGTGATTYLMQVCYVPVADVR